MRKIDFLNKFDKLTFPSNIIIEEAVSKRGIEIAKTTKQVATKTVKQIQQEIRNKKDVDISLGSIVKYKPFYVASPTEREKESCLCKFCLNIRLLFEEYYRGLKDRRKAI